MTLKAHRQRRRVDLARRERRADRRVGEGVGNGRLDQPGDGDDLARFGALDGDALEPAEGEDLGRAAFLDGVAVHVDRLDRHVHRQPAAVDPPGEDAAEERVAVEQSGEHPERAGVDARRRDVADDGLEQRRQVALADVVGEAGVAGAAAGVERREIELLVVRVEVEEKLENLVENFGGARVGAVDLVDHDDRARGPARAPCR